MSKNKIEISYRVGNLIEEIKGWGVMFLIFLSGTYILTDLSYETDSGAGSHLQTLESFLTRYAICSGILIAILFFICIAIKRSHIKTE